jgi:histidine decarboxylase
MAAPSPRFSLAEAVDGAVGPFGPYCMGYMNPGASGYGYINAMKLSVGKVSVQGLDPGTESIVSYDRCEKNDAYIGQMNMLTASSFCGINGALWGYHLARAGTIADGSLPPLFSYPGPQDPAGEKLPRQSAVPVYPVAPLLDAAERLFGRMDQHPEGNIDRRRFPPLPGAHVVCANKSVGSRGPCYVWSAIAVAIAEDRDSTANLFIEDANVAAAQPGSDGAMQALLEQSLRAVAKSIILCGQEQNIVFNRIYAGAKYLYVGPDEWGCALACAPYLLLARDAIPAGRTAGSLIGLDLRQWENALGLAALPPAAPLPGSGGIGVCLSYPSCR